jgi:hypothetical protein
MTILLRFHDLQKRKIVNNWATLSRWIQHEGFPAGIKPGPNTRAWDEASIDQWLASRPTANSETEAA